MTQEQLAGILGVSAPAVSKWETDSSYPDITMLCPLARALGTNVDSLLAFEEALSEEELGRQMTEIVEIIRSGRPQEAEERVNGLLHSYPSNINLKYSAVGTFSLIEMNSPDCSEADQERWAARRKELSGAIYESGEPAFRLPAISMLVSLALAEEDLDRAEVLLKETLTKAGDFTPLWVQLYLKKGQRDEAVAVVQRQLYHMVANTRACLMTMLGENLKLEEERVSEICKVFRQMEEIFGLGGGIGVGALAEVYLRQGRREEALRALEEMAEGLANQTGPNPLLFAPAISAGMQQPKEFLMVCIRGLQTDECFETIRGEERFRKVMEKLETVIEGRGESG